MRVALRKAGVKAACIDVDFGCRPTHIGIIETKRPRELRKMTADLRDDHVPYGEIDARVRLVDFPNRVCHRHSPLRDLSELCGRMALATRRLTPI
jgi:hypothetical protein